jgi:membrane fusion protein (multidrug efflux system)
MSIQPDVGRRVLPRVLAAAGILLICGLGVAYWLRARHFESTDDAVVDGNISQISSQIGGRVVALLVQDNQTVVAGQVLLELDAGDQSVRLAQSQAQRDQAAASLAETRAMLAVRQAERDRVQARRDLSRYISVNPRAISAQQIDQGRAAASGAAARVDAARQAESASRAQLDVLKTRIAGAEAALRLADANLADARLQLSYTHILAPAAGRVARRTVQLGNYVTPGQPLLAVVQPACWVTANFKESQLVDMRPGQAVEIAIDALGGRMLTGHVESLQPGTRSVFSSLPVENPTGNYVKVVQRLPVKIAFDGDSCAGLAPGMSVEPSVHVR